MAAQIINQSVANQKQTCDIDPIRRQLHDLINEAHAVAIEQIQVKFADDLPASCRDSVAILIWLLDKAIVALAKLPSADLIDD